jgi:septum formation protein
MRRLSAAFIDRYLAEAGQTILGCVGAYQLESLGIHLFEHVEGDHSTILGLPLLPLLAALRRQGAVAS